MPIFKVSQFRTIAFCLALLISSSCSRKDNLLDKYANNSRETVADVTGPGANESALDDPASVAADSTQATFYSDQQLRDAALKGDGGTVDKALEAGIDVNSPNENGQTALMLAAYDGHTEIVRLLLKHKAQVNRKDATDRTALIYSASGKNPETVRVLLEAGADVDIVDNQENFNALMFAAAEGHIEVVRLLLEHGADPTAADVDGETSLQFAQNNGHLEVAKLIQSKIEARSQE